MSGRHSQRRRALYERDNVPIVCSVMLKAPRALLMLLVGIFATGCASTGAVPRPFPTPSPHDRGVPTPDASTVDSSVPSPDSSVANPETAGPNPGFDGYFVAGTALQLRGTQYRLGGAEPEGGFDCSGLVQYVYALYGIAVPRDVRSQYHATHKIEDEDIQPGDLLFFATEGRDASHVAIAISSNQFVHAPNSKGVVRVETLKSDYWAPRYLGAHRVTDSRQLAAGSRQ